MGFYFYTFLKCFLFENFFALLNAIFKTVFADFFFELKITIVSVWLIHSLWIREREEKRDELHLSEMNFIGSAKHCSLALQLSWFLQLKAFYATFTGANVHLFPPLNLPQLFSNIYTEYAAKKSGR